MLGTLLAQQGGGIQETGTRSATPPHRKPPLPVPGSGLLCPPSPPCPSPAGSAPPPVAERDRGGSRLKHHFSSNLTLLKGNFLLPASGTTHGAGFHTHRGTSPASHPPPTKGPSIPPFTSCHMVLSSITSSSSSTAASGPGGCSLPFSRQCCLYRYSITLAGERAGLTHPPWEPRLRGSSRTGFWGAPEPPYGAAPGLGPHYVPLTCVGREGPPPLRGLLANCPAAPAPGSPSRACLSNGGGSRPRPGASASGSPSSAG